MAMELTSTMKNDVKTLYEDVYNVLSTHCKLNRISMSILQSMCFNGFKRWHRHRSREFFELKIRLCNEVFDKFRMLVDFKADDVAYSPKSLEEHLKSWSDALLDGIEKLGAYNKRYFELTGTESCIVKDALCIMIKDYEKTTRLYQRFSDGDWLTLDMHMVDDALYCKYKAKEEEHGFKY